MKTEFCCIDRCKLLNNPEYNYLITMGWVVVLKNNKPVNFMADCGDVECIERYYCVEGVFASICEDHPESDVVTIIQEYNKLRQRLFELL